jgi:hypothetical protein
MAKTGYVINKGIQQVFTSGPFSGSLVTSSYSLNDNLVGPIIDTKISFISGTLDTLLPCSTTYTRYFLDPYNCPTSGCPQPIMLSAAVQNCESYDYKYEVTYNFISASTYVPTTKIEYSTDSTFTTNTGSVTYSNTSSIHLPINVSGLSPTPIATSNVYFRAVNYCVGSISSSYSNIISASCISTTTCCTPTLNSISNNFGILSIEWTLGTGTCNTVSAVTVQSSIDGNTWTDFTGSPVSPRTFSTPTVTTYYRIISNCTGGGISAVSNTLTYIPPISGQSYVVVGPEGNQNDACIAGNYTGPVLGLYYITDNNIAVGSTVYLNPIFGPPIEVTGAPGWYAIAASFIGVYTPVRLDTNGVIVEVGEICITGF